jgi:hypothetical protein
MKSKNNGQIIDIKQLHTQCEHNFRVFIQFDPLISLQRFAQSFVEYGKQEHFKAKYY